MKQESIASPPKFVFRGEIYLVDFSENGSEYGESVQCGKRPCVILSNDVGNRYSRVVNCCVLSTKQMKKDYPTHLRLEPNEMNKLKQTSIAMVEQLRTVGKEKLKFKIGKLTEEEIHKLNEVIAVTLGLS